MYTREEEKDGGNGSNEEKVRANVQKHQATEVMCACEGWGKRGDKGH